MCTRGSSVHTALWPNTRALYQRVTIEIETSWKLPPGMRLGDNRNAFSRSACLWKKKTKRRLAYSAVELARSNMAIDKEIARVDDKLEYDAVR